MRLETSLNLMLKIFLRNHREKTNNKAKNKNKTKQKKTKKQKTKQNKTKNTQK